MPNIDTVAREDQVSEYEPEVSKFMVRLRSITRSHAENGLQVMKAEQCGDTELAKSLSEKGDNILKLLHAVEEAGPERYMQVLSVFRNKA